MTTHVTEREERRQRARERFLRQIRASGIKPLDDEILRAMSRVWPPDESVDEFLEERKRWYSEETYQSRS